MLSTAVVPPLLMGQGEAKARGVGVAGGHGGDGGGMAARREEEISVRGGGGGGDSDSGPLVMTLQSVRGGPGSGPGGGFSIGGDGSAAVSVSREAGGRVAEGADGESPGLAATSTLHAHVQTIPTMGHSAHTGHGGQTGPSGQSGQASHTGQSGHTGNSTTTGHSTQQSRSRSSLYRRNGFHVFLKSAKWADVLLKIKTSDNKMTTVPAHRLVLGWRSHFFEDLFNHAPKEFSQKGLPVYQLPILPPHRAMHEVVGKILWALYTLDEALPQPQPFFPPPTAEVPRKWDEVIGVVRVAALLELPHYVDEAQTIIDEALAEKVAVVEAPAPVHTATPVPATSAPPRHPTPPSGDRLSQSSNSSKSGNQPTKLSSDKASIHSNGPPSISDGHSPITPPAITRTATPPVNPPASIPPPSPSQGVPPGRPQSTRSTTSLADKPKQFPLAAEAETASLAPDWEPDSPVETESLGAFTQDPVPRTSTPSVPLPSTSTPAVPAAATAVPSSTPAPPTTTPREDATLKPPPRRTPQPPPPPSPATLLVIALEARAWDLPNLHLRASRRLASLLCPPTCPDALLASAPPEALSLAIPCVPDHTRFALVRRYLAARKAHAQPVHPDARAGLWGQVDFSRAPVADLEAGFDDASVPVTNILDAACAVAGRDPSILSGASLDLVTATLEHGVGSGALSPPEQYRLVRAWAIRNRDLASGDAAQAVEGLWRSVEFERFEITELEVASRERVAPADVVMEAMLGRLKSSHPISDSTSYQGPLFPGYHAPAPQMPYRSMSSLALRQNPGPAQAHVAPIRPDSAQGSGPGGPGSPSLGAVGSSGGNGGNSVFPFPTTAPAPLPPIKPPRSQPPVGPPTASGQGGDGYAKPGSASVLSETDPAELASSLIAAHAPRLGGSGTGGAVGNIPVSQAFSAPDVLSSSPPGPATPTGFKRGPSYADLSSPQPVIDEGRNLRRSGRASEDHGLSGSEQTVPSPTGWGTMPRGGLQSARPSTTSMSGRPSLVGFGGGSTREDGEEGKRGAKRFGIFGGM
ncbi:hypothetical protein M427DRAFT_32958 [Gonapodya prolifera JEL478]|uniref:BTB domain-containing protein n=1 Tax=Gonapodya prolifera (strain JEL478) TaxID=1344416 RepID=A0A139ADT5_GONPJ|nr:hypothetical protein M427DRAFT_32958 [Gonapodya prolifera JEL478]|eukprot:KXS14754.1 hypothetical protein M427DRAFT_32958 [Gonapodya prolifera JEL478]